MLQPSSQPDVNTLPSIKVRKASSEKPESVQALTDVPRRKVEGVCPPLGTEGLE